MLRSGQKGRDKVKSWYVTLQRSGFSTLCRVMMLLLLMMKMMRVWAPLLHQHETHKIPPNWRRSLHSCNHHLQHSIRCHILGVNIALHAVPMVLFGAVWVASPWQAELQPYVLVAVVVFLM
jgi:hypothetical protein